MLIYHYKANEEEIHSGEKMFKLKLQSSHADFEIFIQIFHGIISHQPMD
jgi:hypothetical protein